MRPASHYRAASFPEFIVKLDGAGTEPQSAFSKATSSSALPQSLRMLPNFERVRSERTNPSGGLMPGFPFGENCHMAKVTNCGEALSPLAAVGMLSLAPAVVLRSIAFWSASSTFRLPRQIEAASSAAAIVPWDWRTDKRPTKGALNSLAGEKS